MEYNVERFAAASGVKIDTIRFYQGSGLIPAPARRGRNAIYGAHHLSRIRQIRSLLGQGFTLAQIGRLPAPEEVANPNQVVEASPSPNALLDSLVSALAEERTGEHRLTRSELAAEAGVPVHLVDAAQQAGA